MGEFANLIIERADTSESSFEAVFGLLLRLHREGGYAPLDPVKARVNAYRVIEEGMTFLARRDGHPVGTLSLTELSFWYAQSTFLQDGWFYVSPEFRKGRVGIALMRAAREEAQRRNRIAFVTVNNPDRRPKSTTMSLESQTAGYVPLGYTMKIT